MKEKYRKLGFGSLIISQFEDSGFYGYVEPEYNVEDFSQLIGTNFQNYLLTNDIINGFLFTSGQSPLTSPVNDLGYPIQDPRNIGNTVGYFKVTTQPSGTSTPAEFTQVRLSGIESQNSGEIGFFIASPKNENYEAKITILGETFEVSSLYGNAIKEISASGNTIINYNGYVHDKNLDFINIIFNLTDPS